MYQHQVQDMVRDPAILDLTDSVRDRAQVFVNKRHAATLTRLEAETAPISNVRPGDVLSLLVENQGRVGFGVKNVDFKGLIKGVKMAQNLQNWTMFSLPLNDTAKLQKYVGTMQYLKEINPKLRRSMQSDHLAGLPSFWTANFTISCQDGKHPLDTFLDPRGWSKGVAFVNGFNLGRYWPVLGPQVTLYVPRSVLKCGQNQVILFEQERIDCAATNSCYIEFVTDPIIDGPVPASKSQENAFTSPNTPTGRWDF